MDYIMDTPAEGRRIERKTSRDATLADLRSAGIAAGMAVADIGCAAGTTCRLMAPLVGPAGMVIGVDGSADRIEQAQSFAGSGDGPAIDYRVGEATALPIDDSTVDLCWSRFLFEYLPDPQRALAEMVRITRPGGTVAVIDLDGNCAWHDPIEGELRDGIDRALATLRGGFDPHVGRKLYGWFACSGLVDIAVDVRPYHVIAGSIDDERAEHWRMKLDGVANALIARGWTRDEANDLTARYMDHLLDPATFTYSVRIMVSGRRPG